MQATKDSFYVTMRDRLATLDPQRTMVLNGATRPAIVVVENESPGAVETLTGTFCLRWGNARAAHPATGGLIAMECTISYRSSGTSANDEYDRGRDLGSMDTDLLSMCEPRNALKCDYSGGSAVPLGSEIFWTRPALTLAKDNGQQYAAREAALTVFFFPESES